MLDIPILTNGPKTSKSLFLFAHGAGAPMDSGFMNTLSEGLADKKILVKRFEFPYMQERRENGKRKPPNSQKILLETWKQVILQESKGKSLFIGGKSMGGRMASLIANEIHPKGLICLGYPFHPPGKPENLRTEHLENLEIPTLILQGERDALGNQIEVLDYQLSDKISLQWFPDGDHSLKPRKKSGYSEADHLASAVDYIHKFIQQYS